MDETTLTRCLSDFPGVPHRLERVGTFQGVHYINDSKATNVDACFVALDAQTTPVVLIVGGLDKGNDYTTLFPLITSKCRALVFLGANNAPLHEVFDTLCAEHSIAIADTDSMEDCVAACAKLAQEGTPCSSLPAAHRSTSSKTWVIAAINSKTSYVNAKLPLHEVQIITWRQSHLGNLLHALHHFCCRGVQCSVLSRIEGRKFC